MAALLRHSFTGPPFDGGLVGWAAICLYTSAFARFIKMVKRATFTLLVERAIKLVVGLAGTAIIARLLAPEHFGVISYVAASVQIFAPLCVMGLNGLVTKSLVENAEFQGTILGSAVFVRCIGGLASIILALMAQAFLKLDGHILVYLAIFSITSAFASLNVFTNWFEANKQFELLAIIRALSALVFGVLKVLVAYRYRQWEAVILIQAIEVAVTALLPLFLFRIKRHTYNHHEPRLVKTFLADGRWLFFSSLAYMVYLKLDQIMVGQLLGHEVLGSFSIAARLSEAWAFIPTVIMSVMFPQLVLQKKDDQARYRQLLVKAIRLLFTLGAGVWLIVFFVGEAAIDFAFGDAYKAAYPVLVVYALSSLPAFPRVVLSKWLIIEELHKFSLSSHLCGAVVNILLNVIWIPRYGPQGAAWATVVAFFASTYLFSWAHPKTREFTHLIHESAFLKAYAK